MLSDIAAALPIALYAQGRLSLATQLVGQLLDTLPDDFLFEVSVEDHELAVTLSGGDSWIIATYPEQLEDTELAYRILDDLRHFIHDSYGQWWPQLERQRLDYLVDCREGVPQVQFCLNFSAETCGDAPSSSEQASQKTGY